MTGRAGVPAFREHVFGPRRSRYCCCVFVLNEGERFLAQIDRMGALALGVDVIVADGGSTDGAATPERLERRGLRALLVKTGAGRLSAQHRMAYAWALGQGYEGVVTIDGNGKDGVEAIPEFVRALAEGADHVQGSRFLPGGKAENTPWLRWLGIRLIHAPLTSIAAGFRYTDTTNGFRAYSARLLTDARTAPLRDVFVGYELPYYLAVRAPRLGFRVLEIPVTRRYPKRGVPTKIHGLVGNLGVLRTLLEVCLGRYDPSPLG